jgi:hypothetical protein
MATAKQLQSVKSAYPIIKASRNGIATTGAKIFLSICAQNPGPLPEDKFERMEKVKEMNSKFIPLLQKTCINIQKSGYKINHSQTIQKVSISILKDCLLEEYPHFKSIIHYLISNIPSDFPITETPQKPQEFKHLFKPTNGKSVRAEYRDYTKNAVSYGIEPTEEQIQRAEERLTQPKVRPIIVKCSIGQVDQVIKAYEHFGEIEVKNLNRQYNIYGSDPKMIIVTPFQRTQEQEIKNRLYNPTSN